MSAGCHHEHGRADAERLRNPGYRRVLWTVLALNAAMFAVEGTAGLFGGSVALQADALDFLGDAATYGLSLAVLGMALRWRAAAALLKGGTMALFGLWVVGNVAWHAIAGSQPSAPTMGVVGTLALATNVACALLLFRFREGDANMRSVWLCTRNDAIGNVAVLAAGGGVFLTASNWPDLLVGLAMGALALWSAILVLRQAMREVGMPIRTTSSIACPACGIARAEQMPEDRCVVRWRCESCGAELRSPESDCCVYCSFGDVPCPPVQRQRLAA